MIFRSLRQPTLVFALVLAFEVAPAQAPFQTIVQPNGTTRHYNVDAGDPNSGRVDSSWVFVKGEPITEPSTFMQGLPAGDRGWQDENIKSDGNGRLVPTAPLFRNGAWRPGWYRTWHEPPIGAWKRVVWPPEEGALTVKTNNSIIVATIKGSPCESLRVIGNNNRIYVSADSGEQSRLMLTRPAVLVQGNGNTVGGWVRHPLCALYLRGSNNNVVNLTAVLGPQDVGDDKGAIYFEGKKGQRGGSVLNTTVISEGRGYGYAHMTAGVYPDDRYSHLRIKNLTVIGRFKYGVFSHGGQYVTIDGLRTKGSDNSFKFAPHFSEPRVQPRGCSARNVVKEAA